VLAKLAEVLFIEVLRLYMNEHVVRRTGWLVGVGDRIVGAALNALHERPARVDAGRLAQGCDVAVGARRTLHAAVGSSPMQYLTQWRMLLAANLLCRSNTPLARIARRRLPNGRGIQPRVSPQFGAPPARGAARRRRAQAG
jgi:methylphosphotriester-DNA--protein-cysteine methyltransferase